MCTYANDILVSYGLTDSRVVQATRCNRVNWWRHRKTGVIGKFLTDTHDQKTLSYQNTTTGIRRTARGLEVRSKTYLSIIIYLFDKMFSGTVSTDWLEILHGHSSGSEECQCRSYKLYWAAWSHLLVTYYVRKFYDFNDITFITFSYAIFARVTAGF